MSHRSGNAIRMVLLMAFVCLFSYGWYSVWDSAHHPVLQDSRTIVEPIASLDVSHGIDGFFVLGIGSISSMDKYVFMRDMGNNRYVRGSLETDVQLEESSEPPGIVYDVTHYKGDPNDHIENKRIRVPFGTIVRRYQVE